MRRCVFGSLWVAVLVFAVASGAFAQDSTITYTKYGQDYAKYGSAQDVPGMCSYASIAKKDYSGKTLKIITDAPPVMGEPTNLHAKQFADLTGAKVDVVYAPFGDLWQRIMVPFQTGVAAYDVMFYGSLWIGDFSNYLAPVPEKYLSSPGMQEVTPTYREVATWGDQMLQYPVDGDRNYLKYRSDIFNDPAMQQKFKDATGHDLGVPKTWEQYNEIAKFFSRWDWAGDGKTHYGSAEITKSDDLMWSAIIDRVAAYAKNPNVTSGFFFDLNTMKPQVNNPGWVKGVQMYVDAKQAWPPGGDNFGLGDEIFSFGGGQTLMSYTWDDAFIQAQEPGNAIRNKVMAAPIPGSNDVWNYQTQQWDHFDTPNNPQYVTWGWTAAVAKASKQQEMAFDYLCFFSNHANHSLDLRIGRFGDNPYKQWDFDASFWEQHDGWTPQVAEAYVNTLDFIDKTNNQVWDLRVPGVNAFMSSLDKGVAQAIAGQKTVQQALDDVASEWEQILKNVGEQKVHDAYAKVVAIENHQY